MNSKKLLGCRIREIKRKNLHEHNKVLRNIYKDHIKFLESRLRNDD
jgi:hypothetical protein